jgi:dGTPase
MPNRRGRSDTTQPEANNHEATGSVPVSDPKTSEIIWTIAVAAHEHSKSHTKTLTSLKHTKDQPVPQKRTSPSEKYDGLFGQAAYDTRLFRGKAQSQRYITQFAKDYARIVHSPSFRKLQGKTQLIPAGENYFFRTRLTHSIEVAEIATRIAHKLNTSSTLAGRYKIDYDLVTCAALLHDIGHPPFGHSGEEALNEMMAAHRLSFEGNAQTLRLVTRLENRLGRGNSVDGVYDDPRGLNLTVGTLASILKYDKRWRRPQEKKDSLPKIIKAYYPEEGTTVDAIKRRLQVKGRLYTLECQIMDLADDIAYSAYDLEDAMEGSIITPFDFISVDDETLGRITADVEKQLQKREPKTTISSKEVLEELAKVFGTILKFRHRDNYRMNQWRDRVVFVARSHNEAILHAKNPLIRRQFLETLIEGNIEEIEVELNADQPFMSVLKPHPERLRTMECMKAFNYHKVISSRKLQIPHYRAKLIIKSLFEALCKDPDGVLLSDVERAQLAKFDEDDPRRLRLICDVIAGMTDREAVKLFNHLNSGNDLSVFAYV